MTHPESEAPGRSSKVYFMHFGFSKGSGDEIRARVRDLSSQSYRYWVTPNVDYVVKCTGGRLRPEELDAVQGAEEMLCDSKPLVFLARRVGVELDHYPGSDLTADLMADPSFDETTFVIIGPTRAGFEALKLRYPRRKLRFVEAPYPLRPGSTEWDRCVAELCEGEWQIGLFGLPMPLQQMLAKALAERGRGTGLALCVGAAVDFLTGWQRCAPRWVRRTGLESLHRLQANPRRMWRRYLIEAPQIFPMYGRLEVMPRLGRRLTAVVNPGTP